MERKLTAILRPFQDLNRFVDLPVLEHFLAARRRVKFWFRNLSEENLEF
jgi:hypothetical protein